MFQLTKEEWDCLRLQNETLKPGFGQHTKYYPCAFIEQGIAMLSGVLNSYKAIEIYIAIMRAFVAIIKVLLIESDFKLQMQLVKEKLGSHDEQLNQIYDALDNLLNEKAAQRKWDDRERIGFNK